ncbi:CAAD domain-containing protein [Oscillatoria sp. FACHB-1406]|uniref:CAAD domain-containing protein n=1 Tax=Oscillatoria sp. FACHB-1406 TaxID=2692846 RepID=UPI001689509C|nr:CAAD domain-containing protein [Oscillatoria sp. FACHB-1406]MBD2578532.1 CAAD domain-containing protein [Oscillatoria sp. FACHB-1406]
MQEPEIKTVEQSPVGIKTEPAGQIAYPASEPAWQEWAETVSEFTSQLPNYIARFFSDYKQPLLTLGLFIAGIITVKVTLALLDAINDIPLLAPGLELVGLGYTGWFVYRYLLKAADRQELVAEVNKLKTQVLGSDS